MSKVLCLGSPRFCDVLRGCRARGLSLSQVQVIGVLSTGRATVLDVQGATGLTYDGARKAMYRLFALGDVMPVGARCESQVWVLSECGWALVEEVCGEGA